MLTGDGRRIFIVGSKMTLPLISIIVPVYNVEKYIEQSIESLRQQTLKNIEIILIDDGSTDSSGDICDKYAQLDKRIKVIHKENGGLGSAWNEGLKHVSGQYYAFTDSDDFVSPVMFENLYKTAEKTQADVTCCGFVWYTATQSYYNRGPEDSIYGTREFLMAILSIKDSGNYSVNGGYVWNKLFSRKLLEKANFLDAPVYVEDELYLCKLLPYIRVVSFVRGAFYFYRMREQSAIHQVGFAHRLVKTRLRMLELIKKNKEKFDEYNYNGVYLAVRVAICNALFYGISDAIRDSAPKKTWKELIQLAETAKLKELLMDKKVKDSLGNKWCRSLKILSYMGDLAPVMLKMAFGSYRIYKKFF